MIHFGQISSEEFLAEYWQKNPYSLSMQYRILFLPCLQMSWLDSLARKSSNQE